MKSEQIQLIQTSFAHVMPIADAAADLFYRRLFELDPAMRPLFRGDMKAQGRKLMSMLKLAVNSLDRLESLLSALQELGRQHVAYGIQPQHYDTVGAALLWTLAQGLGAAFTPEVEAAWTELYALLAGVMQEAAGEQKHSVMIGENN